MEGINTIHHWLRYLISYRTFLTCPVPFPHQIWSPILLLSLLNPTSRIKELEVVARRCSAKEVFLQFPKIYREMPLPKSYAGLRSETLLKKRRDSDTSFFPWILQKILRTVFPIEHIQWMLPNNFGHPLSECFYSYLGAIDLVRTQNPPPPKKIFLTPW